MVEIKISLTDEKWNELRRLAQRLGIAPEEMARMSIEDLLTGSGDSIQGQMEYVIEKNKELYQRLAR